MSGAPPRASAMSSSVARFVARVFAWLPVTFVAWHFATPLLTWPVAAIAEAVARLAFGDLVREIAQSGATLAFTTTLRPAGAVAQTGELTVDVDLRLYAFGLPLYAALALAAREPHWPRHLLTGYAVVLPFAAWGVLADFLKSVAIASGPAIAAQTGFVAWQRELIAVAYQVGSLVLPTVVPAATWLVTHRAFVERLRRPAAA